MIVRGADGRVLAQRCCRGEDYWMRLRGLMFRPSFGDWDGLWLDRNNAIHMWFVRFAIDLVWLDRDLRVVGLRPGLAPWKIAWQRGAQSCIEFPVGVIASSNIAIGDQLTFEDG